MREVWPGVVVNQETISQRVKLVRDALGDDPQNPRYIAGIRGRGYKIIAVVEPVLDADASALRTAETSGTEHAQSSAAAGVTSSQRPNWRWWVLGGIAAAVIAVGIPIGLAQLRERQPESVVVRLPPPRTIVILPFVDLSGDAQNEYFGDGLTEELISRVGQIPELHVIARTSA